MDEKKILTELEKLKKEIETLKSKPSFLQDILKVKWVPILLIFIGSIVSALAWLATDNPVVGLTLIVVIGIQHRPSLRRLSRHRQSRILRPRHRFRCQWRRVAAAGDRPRQAMYAFVIWAAAGGGMRGPLSLNVFAELWQAAVQPIFLNLGVWL